MSINGDIDRKIGRVTGIIALALLLILVRVWYLAGVKHEEYAEKARRPQRRTIVESIGRASICDRFNLPLAINKVQFNAAICYADIRQIPLKKWEIDEQGKKIKLFPREQYIAKLAELLHQELNIDAKDIEDAIYAKASLRPHTPFVLAENISEEQYFRLRMMEKQWPGIIAERGSKRHYPYGKTACDVIGMMGAISQEEYSRIIGRIKELEVYVSQREKGETPFLPQGFLSPWEVRDKLAELQQKACTIRDLVGKSGIESAFDYDLKGANGKKIFEVDVKGNILRELPTGIPAEPGKKIALALSVELQEYAEQLLAQAEAKRCKSLGSLSEPWIKGGAIVVMDAKTGEILTLASHPRFNPSDFLPGKERANILQWLENEDYLAKIWDGEVKMKREFYDKKNGFQIEDLRMSWSNFKETVLPKQGIIKQYLETVDTLGKIFSIQESHLKIKTNASHDWPVLAADLCRLIARVEDYPTSLRAKMSLLKCEDFFSQRQAYLSLSYQVENIARKSFEKTLFSEWRAKKFKTFLKQKRAEEKNEKRPARPYTDYLEERKKTIFKEFWASFRLPLLEALLTGEKKSLPLINELGSYFELVIGNDPHLQQLAHFLKTLNAVERKAVLRSLKGFKELTMPLLGRYPRIRKENGMQKLKHLAASFYPINGYGFGRSQAFRQSTPAGSVFKLVIGYQALMERYASLKEQIKSLDILNPLTLVDDSPQKGSAPSLLFGKTAEGRPITRLYKGGRLPRSSHAGIGKVDFISAIEQSSNIYFSLLAAEHVQEPESLVQVGLQFGYGEKSGIELPGEIAGHLPSDLAEDKTAIYAYAIGQHSLVVTPLQTAMMVGAIVGEGNVLKPSIVRYKSVEEQRKEPGAVFENRCFSHAEKFADIGIHFPIFTLVEPKQKHSACAYSKTQVKRSLAYPKEIRKILLEGMRRTVHGSKGTARPSAVRGVCFNEETYRDYLTVLPKIAGKTGTAEILHKQSIDTETKATLRKHTWFAGASFSRDQSGNIDWNDPQIVVVVYLRFADAGREAAPLAGLMIKKWEEICARGLRSI